MKIYFHIGEPTICGGILIPCQYIGELRKRGYEAYGVSEGYNEALEKYMGTPFIPMSEINTTDKDIIIAVRWEFCEELEKYAGRKFQFVQGRDEDANCGEDWKIKMREARNNKKWELIGVSDFCLKDWGRGTVVPNFIDKRFFMADMEKFYLERDIDFLIEGNNEPNKNIDEAIALAKAKTNLVGSKIVWMGRETKPVEGVECITNPSQEEIPNIYRRSKVLIKLSKSEGFSLPIVEAMASGCLVVTNMEMTRNGFCAPGINCMVSASMSLLKDKKERDWHQKWGYDTAEKFKIETSTDKLLTVIGICAKMEE